MPTFANYKVHTKTYYENYGSVITWVHEQQYFRDVLGGNSGSI